MKSVKFIGHGIQDTGHRTQDTGHRLQVTGIGDIAQAICHRIWVTINRIHYIGYSTNTPDIGNSTQHTTHRTTDHNTHIKQNITQTT